MENEQWRIENWNFGSLPFDFLSINIASKGSILFSSAMKEIGFMDWQFWA
jgi:hypothetical protein